MNPNLKTAKRIANLRKERGYSQEQFRKIFSEYECRKQPLSIMTVSSWETGKKQPPASVILDLATFYGVSTDYLFGLCDTVDKTYTKSNRYKASPEIEIKWTELIYHNNTPVYVVFNNENYHNQWGILDYTQKQVVFKDFKMILTKQCSYFIAVPAEEITIKNKTRKLITMRSLMDRDKVWIESLSPDALIRGKIDGWYEHDITKSFLINKATGQTLPYNGLGITYNAMDLL